MTPVGVEKLDAELVLGAQGGSVDHMGDLPCEVGLGWMTGVGGQADLHIPLDLQGRVKPRVGGLESCLDDLKRTGNDCSSSSTNTENEEIILHISSVFELDIPLFIFYFL